MDLAELAVDLDPLGAGLEVGAERPLALVADEQDRRVRVADQVAEVARRRARRSASRSRRRSCTAAGRVAIACDSSTRRVTSGPGSRAACRPRGGASRSPRRSTPGGAGRCRRPLRPSASRGRAAAAGSRPRRCSRSSCQTTSWVRPIANDGTSSTPLDSATSRTVSARIRIASSPRLVLAAAVGRLDEDVVGVGQDRRVADDRRAGPAEVAARRRSSVPARRCVRRRGPG